MEYTLTPVDQQKLNSAVEEATISLQRQQMEKDFRKDVADRMKEELDISTSDFNALVNERFKNASTEAIEKHEAVTELNQLLINNCKKTSTPASEEEEENDGSY